MEYGICNLSIVPVRAETSDKGEIVTQLLFGDHFTVLSRKKQWCKIRLAYDDYEGWIDEKQFCKITPEEFSQLLTEPPALVLDLMQFTLFGQTMVPLLMGSQLPFYNGSNSRIGLTEYQFNGHTRPLGEQISNKNDLIQTAYSYLHSPYLWGGKTPFGIDCSGLTQMVFKLNGVPLKRDASQQADQGILLNFLEEAEPGDLAFFDNEEGKIIHVGIVLPQGQIIHASGKVRIDKLDHHGIFNAETNKYSHKLRLLKRIV